jgi:YD repeat-containing protein
MGGAGATAVTDRNGNLTTYIYDSHYQTTKVKDAAGYISNYTYDGGGRLLQLQDANQHTTTYTYYPNGLPWQTTYPTVTNVDGSPSQTYNSSVTYNAQNQPTLIVATTGMQTKFSYTPDGNVLLQETDPLQNKVNYSYSDSAHPARQTGSSSTNGLSSTTHYDANGYPTRHTLSFTTLVQASGTTPQAVNYATDYTYNSVGELLYQSDSYDTATSSAQANPGTTYQYDPAGHLLNTTNQLSQTSTNSYDAVGNRLSSINYLGQEIDYTYDNLENLLTRSQSVLGQTYTTSYHYDQNENLSGVDGPDLQVQTFNYYDNLDHLNVSSTPLLDGYPVVSYRYYDGVGNLTKTQQLTQLRTVGVAHRRLTTLTMS